MLFTQWLSGPDSVCIRKVAVYKSYSEVLKVLLVLNLITLAVMGMSEYVKLVGH